MKKNRQHYNRVIDAWKDIMNNNIHFGYYKSVDTSLIEGGNGLIDLMIGLAAADKNTSMLDVGCGVGNPAFYIHKKYGCRITGITTSERGVEIANQESRRLGYADKVRFMVADGTGNSLPDESFDIAWVMESSHLMQKRNLLRECFRVLKGNGTLLLCDVMFKYYTPFMYIFTMPQYLFKFLHLKRAYGDVRPAPLERYWKLLNEAGFKEITTIDIGSSTIQTLRDWKDNIRDKEEVILKNYTRADIDEFIRAGDIMEYFFRKNIITYSVIRAAKSQG
jgi:27-O-demethylrifamycin SV methyltransferase